MTCKFVHEIFNGKIRRRFVGILIVLLEGFICLFCHELILVNFMKKMRLETIVRLPKLNIVPLLVSSRSSVAYSKRARQIRLCAIKGMVYYALGARGYIVRCTACYEHREVARKFHLVLAEIWLVLPSFLSARHTLGCVLDEENRPW